MYHIRDDQRSLKSAETIYDALTTLIARKPFDSIKVSGLVKEANVSRGTFYRSFDLIEDVLRWQCDQVVGKMVAYLVDYRLSQSSEYPLLGFKPMLRFFYLDSSVIEVLIAANRLDIFQVALQARIDEASQAILPPDAPVKYLNYVSSMRAGVAVNILVQWIQEGKREPPDALADGLSELLMWMLHSKYLL